MSCGACGAANPEGKRFCGDCGAPLAVTCPGCGAEVGAGKRFCGDCGSAVEVPLPVALPGAPAAPAAPAGPVAERRLTSILFGDLVGYTTISESRDPEEVRELLSQYFAMATKVVGRYGGTIEKFIGDAVMAVWGVPVAQEDDAERAVRAGLDLVAEIRVLAGQVGVAELDMRVGILTGETAVTIGATNEGMVAGDSVNTAARIQSAADPGTVWVDDTTRSLTAAAVTYSDAGLHQLKGKSEPLQLYRAGQVVAAVGGAQRVDGLEADLVGRDHDLRLVKELFHGAVAERRPRLVAVSGLAGVGKTRLGWELEKYVDGISQDVFWHRSRVLSYGDGVSFWAIAEMVRSRLGVADGDSAEAIGGKLRTSLSEIVPEAAERAWLLPRVGVLLGLEPPDGGAFERSDLFAAWTTFFERVGGGTSGVVLVIDDMQHADPDLLDFLEHLVDTARYGLFLFTMGRPELLEARPGWGTGRRATTIHLEPLDDAAMGEIVDGLVDGLPEGARAALVASAEGIPLYALEMVRMLVDRAAVVADGGRYVLAPDADQRIDLTTLDAPPSLHALIAARLDRLSTDQRLLVQDASVHGMAFSRGGLEAVTEVADLAHTLDELVRKEILELHTDRFSSERGQYRFVQALVRTVAYETLAKRDRKVRHLKVARYLEGADDGDEYAAINARHYLDAVDSVPNDPDTGQLVALAVGHLERAARRAEALGSPDEALRHYTSALGRDLEPLDQARLLEGAAHTAQVTDRTDLALEHAEGARATYELLGRPVDAGRAIAVAGEALYAGWRFADVVALLQPVYDGLVEVPGADDALLPLASVLARALAMQGDQSALAYNDRAAALAEAREDWTRVALHLNFAAILWSEQGRMTGALALWHSAVDLGRREHLPRAVVNVLSNLCAVYKNRDLVEACAAGREALELAVQSGARDLRRPALINLSLALWLGGYWDEMEDVYRDHADALAGFPYDTAYVVNVLNSIRVARGEPTEDEVAPPNADDDFAGSYTGAWTAGLLAQATGDVGGAAEALGRAVDVAFRLTSFEDDFAILWPLAVMTKLDAGDLDDAQRLLHIVADAPDGRLSPLLRAHLPWIRARVGAASGADGEAIDADLDLAIGAFRDLGATWYLGRSLLDRGVRLVDRGEHEAADPFLDEAESVFRQLRAERWVDQVRELSPAR
jgi:class 3 adenylate cyclase